ncbi:MAG: dihydrodipicolinate synthase family protein [Acidobacteria bacterium]|nr:dihydrodipicolinate synthase family protein [Acidobacteriota bacterium]
MPRYHQGILISCEVPWDEREHLMEDVFRREVQQVLTAGFRNVYIFGTAGEGYAVDTARFHRIVDLFAEETRAEGVHPGVGVIGLSTANIVERISYAHSRGFRFFQISLPSWGAVNDREMVTFFRDVCGAFPDSRFLHYNLARTKRVLTGSDYRRLVAEIPNLAATKNTGTTVQTTAELMREAPELQHFFGEAMFPHGCLHGECSLLSSFGPLAPAKTQEFYRLCTVGDLGQALTFQKKYLEMTHEVLAPMFRQGPLMDGAYDKALVRLGGLEEMPLRLLSPYEGLTEEVFAECRAILHERYKDWLG